VALHYYYTSPSHWCTTQGPLLPLYARTISRHPWLDNVEEDCAAVWLTLAEATFAVEDRRRCWRESARCLDCVLVMHRRRDSRVSTSKRKRTKRTSYGRGQWYVTSGRSRDDSGSHFLTRDPLTHCHLWDEDEVTAVEKQSWRLA